MFSSARPVKPAQTGVVSFDRADRLAAGLHATGSGAGATGEVMGAFEFGATAEGGGGTLSAERACKSSTRMLIAR